MMLGILHVKWERSGSVYVKKGDTHVNIRGKRLEVKLEENNQLRLSLVDMVDNREEKYSEAVAGLMHLLEQRRQDLAISVQELKAITYKLDNFDLEEAVEENLMRQARHKRDMKKKYTKEIKELEAQTTITFHYRKVKTGRTAVLPPGLTLQPGFLSEPVCWCPWNMPACDVVEETSTIVEERPLTLTSAQHTIAFGLGLERYDINLETKFVIDAKDAQGLHCNSGGDNFVIESKEAEIKSSIVDRKNGMYEVSYFVEDITASEGFSLSVTLGGDHICRSPFRVQLQTEKKLLLEFSTGGNPTNDWLNEAKTTMSSISCAKLYVHLYDQNGSEVYNTTGITSCKWSQDYVTSPYGVQHFDDTHINAIPLDNGDRLMIIGKNEEAYNGWIGSAYHPNNIIINAGWNANLLTNGTHRRRMIIALNAPRVEGWVAPDNLISFSSNGFQQCESRAWPPFNGTFRIYYIPLH